MIETYSQPHLGDSPTNPVTAGHHAFASRSLTWLRSALLGASLASVVLTTGAPVTKAAEPTDPNKHYIGINLWFMGTTRGNNAFVDAVKEAGSWQNYGGNAQAVIDADGWPNQDCSAVTFGVDCELGAYTLKFTGQASNIYLLATTGSVTGVSYDAASNTTTATVTPTKRAGGVKFLNTKKTPTSAVNTGISNVRLYRPGYPTDGSVVFTTRFLNAIQKFQVIRFMDWQKTNTNPLVTWAQRHAPFQADPGNVTINGNTGSIGGILEDYIQLCNATNADFWINVPIFADNDYVTKLAQLINYGSDATGTPYTSTVANPVYPPLNSNLKVYLEYGNEIWNSSSGFNCYRWVDAQILPYMTAPYTHPINFDGNTNETTLIARFSAWKLVEMSKIFRSVCGDAAMNTRIRPALMGQLGGNWMNPRQLPWLESFYSTYRPATDPFPNVNPVPVNYHMYAAGGSSYYGVINSGTADPNVFLSGTNYPTPNYVKNTSVDALRSKNYGLKRIAYEGGMDLPSGFTAAQNQALNADAQMQTAVETYHDEWTADGGDLLVYYCLRGAVQWEFTPCIDVLNSPKLLAVDNIRDVYERVPVDMGTRAPGVVDCRAQKDSGVIDSQGTFYNSTINGENCVGGVDPGEWLAYAVNSLQTEQYDLSMRLAAASGTTNSLVMINGVVSGTLSAVTTGAGNLVTSGTMKVILKKGLNAVRIKPLNVLEYHRSITLVESQPPPIPNTVQLFAENFNNGTPAPWTAFLTSGTQNMTMDAGPTLDTIGDLAVGNIHSQLNTTGATAYIQRTHNVAAAGKPSLQGYFDMDFSQLNFNPLTGSGAGTITLFEHWLSTGNRATMSLGLNYSGYLDNYSFSAQDGIHYTGGPTVTQSVSITALQITTPRLRFYYDTLYTQNAGLSWTLTTTWTIVNLDTGATLYTLNPSFTGNAAGTNWNPLTDTAQIFRYGAVKHTTWTGGLLTGSLIWNQIYSGAGD